MNTSLKSYILKYSNKDSVKYKLFIIILSACLLLALFVISICVGSAGIPVRDVLSSIFGFAPDSRFYSIINYVRLPRSAAAVLAGSSLAVSGAILQTVLNNSLASPNIIGVNAGAGMFAIVLSAMFPEMILFTPVAAFAGTLSAALSVYFIAKKTGASRMTIVLAGIAVSSFLGAVTDLIITLYPDSQMSRIAFMIGGFSNISMENIGLCVWIIILGLVSACLFSHDMNIMALGDDTAKSLGLRTEVYRMVFLIIAAVLAGSAVSFAGLLGFVGLIVPHAARFFIGSDNRFLIPLCIFGGGAFTLFCDILARVLFAPFEIPVGIIMSFLGGPFFIYLLLRRKRGKLYD